jgi:hypothetical protein
MRYRDLFALGVRLFGIWLITRGLTYVGAFIDVKLYPVSGPTRDSAGANLIYATLDFALALVFLLWTRTIVTWSYGEKTKSDEHEKSEAGELPVPRIGNQDPTEAGP